MGFCDQKVGFCIFRAVVMIACLSKYDFWNLHKISDWHEKKFFKKIFFWNIKKSQKKSEKKIGGDFSKIFRFFFESEKIFFSDQKKSDLKLPDQFSLTFWTHMNKCLTLKCHKNDPDVAFFFSPSGSSSTFRCTHRHSRAMRTLVE